MKQFLELVCVFGLLMVFQSVLAQDYIVVHTVEEGQTLYSISKSYGLSPDEIRENNPLIDDSYNIKPGQILRIKLKGEEQIQPILSSMEKQPILHRVNSKETLYGISRDYHIDIDKLKDWNQLTESRISVGQELIVGWRYRNKMQGQLPNSSSQPNVNSGSTNTQLPIEASEPAQISTRAPVPSYTSEVEPIQITDKQLLLQQRFEAETSGQLLTTKAGPTIWFNTDNRMMSARYYALFSDAPVGSVIRVKNLINNRVVYAKVIGSLPNTAENHGAMMKMTPAAKETLGVQDAKIRLEVTYAPAAE